MPGSFDDQSFDTGSFSDSAFDFGTGSGVVVAISTRRLVRARSMAFRWIIPMNEAIGAPYAVVDPKRSFDEVPIGIDWHDFLVTRRVPGQAVAIGDRFRPLRGEATGVQYRCTTAGVCSGRPFAQLRWPTTGTVTDGSAIWTAEAIADTSLRTTISSSSWPTVTGLTLGTEASSDQRYQVPASGGSSGRSYLVRNRIVLANGEDKEGVIILPVQD